MTLFALAVALDILAGGRGLLGRIPGTDDLLLRLCASLAKRLNRPQRTAHERLARGIVVALLCVPLAAGFGYWLNGLMAGASPSKAVAILILALTIRLRAAWDLLARARAENTGDSAKPAGDHYTSHRQAVGHLVRQFSEGLIGNLILFLLGGFALVLPFRLIAMMVTAGAPHGTSRPDGSFFTTALFLYEITATPFAVLACLFLAIAPILVPRSYPGAIKGITTPRKGRMLARLAPMAVLAHGTGLAFESKAVDRQGKTLWIGPQDGRARVTRTDLQQAGRLVMAAAGFFALAVTMLASLSLKGFL